MPTYLFLFWFRFRERIDQVFDLFRLDHEIVNKFFLVRYNHTELARVQKTAVDTYLQARPVDHTFLGFSVSLLEPPG